MYFREIIQEDHFPQGLEGVVNRVHSALFSHSVVTISHRCFFLQSELQPFLSVGSPILNFSSKY